MIRLLVTFVALVALAAPGVASAAAAPPPETIAPPGNSAIDEYLETIPSARGNSGPPAGGSQTPAHAAPTPAPVAVLTPTQRQQLKRLGPDGRTLAQIVDTTSPPPSHTAGAAAVPERSAQSPLGATFGVITGHDAGGGMGALLPVILLISTLAIVGLGVRGRRLQRL